MQRTSQENMDTCDNAIREVAQQQSTKWLSKRDIINYIEQKYLKRWKASTIKTQIYACCVNRAGAYKHYPSSPKFLFNQGRLYQLYDEKVHGPLKAQDANDESSQEVTEDQEALSASITLERDLKDYLVRNLGQLESGLKLYSKGRVGGREFNTDAGKIDILACDREGNLVILEVKAGKATHATLGQALAYMNWVRRHVAEGKKVRGIIIADDFDTRLKYAVYETPAVSLKKYEVSFSFKDILVDKH